MLNIMTIESLMFNAEGREMTEFESQRLAVLKAVVEEIRYCADLICADARDARDAGNADLAGQLFAYRDALDRAADIIQWG